MNNEARYIVRVFRKPKREDTNPQAVADILMTGPLYGNEQRFARRHGGDYIVCLSEEDATELPVYY